MQKNQLIATFSPLLVGLVASFFIQEDILLSGIIALSIVGSLVYYHRENEWGWLGMGIVTGFVLEFLGTYTHYVHFWEEGIIFGIPIWILLFWGYAFIFIHRIGDVVVKEKKKS